MNENQGPATNKNNAAKNGVASAKLEPVKPNIYQASAGGIFARNFLAGFSRALGGITVYCLFLLLMVFISLRYLKPRLEPFLTGYQQMIKSLEDLETSGQAWQNFGDLEQLVPAGTSGSGQGAKGAGSGPDSQTDQQLEVLLKELQQQTDAQQSPGQIPE